MTDPSVTGHFAWNELMSPDPNESATFYTKVMGWRTQPFGGPMDYTIFANGDGGVAGLMKSPADMLAAGGQPGWIMYVASANVDATAAMTRQLGGRVCKEPWDIPNVGRIAVLADPQGAMFASITPSGMQQANPHSGASNGAFGWQELATTDIDAAFSFYQQLFGWKKSVAHDMGGMIYQLIANASGDVGGMYLRQPGQPGGASWLSYTRVPNAERAVATIKSAGGTVLNGPMQVPGGTWIVQALDPHGIMFAVLSPGVAAAAKPAAPGKEPAAKAKAKPKAKVKTKAKATPKAKAKAKKAPSRKSAAKKRPAKRRPAKKRTAKKRAAAKRATTRRTAPRRKPKKKAARKK